MKPADVSVCEIKTITTHQSGNISSKKHTPHITAFINNFLNISTILFCVSLLVACSGSSSSGSANGQDQNGNNNPDLTTLDDDSAELTIKTASWDADTLVLSVAGDYSPGDFDSDEIPDSIIITDVDMPSVNLAKISIDATDGDINWLTDISSLTTAPCQIKASAGDANHMLAVENAGSNCGGGGPPANMQPIAIISPATDQAITVGTSITFIGDTSTDPDNNTPLTYEWTILGGTTTATLPTAANQPVLYESTGTFTASLIVTDSLGLASMPTTITIVVTAIAGNQAPTAAIITTPLADNSGTVNITTANGNNVVIFAGNTSSDPDGNTPLTYNWAFAGGTPATSTVALPGNVSYSTAGNYQATLIVTDSLGLASTMASVNVTVVNPAATNIAPTAVITSTPVADATSGDILIATGADVTFNGGSSNDADGNTPLTYLWTFGGVAADSTMVLPPTVNFATAGTYAITLTVTDSLGLASAVVTANVVVTDAAPANVAPIAAIVTTPIANGNGIINITTAAGNNTVNFSGNTSSDPDGNGNAPLTYDWVFNGGTPATSAMAVPGNVVYATAGSFQATLIVTDALGLASPIISVPVVVTAPTTAGQTISFIVLNDLHANLVAHSDQVRTLVNGVPTVTTVQRGGLARIAAEANRIRTENPNSAFLNIGDTFYGSVESFYSDGNDIVTAINTLGIDVGVPGNWDFAYGPNATRARFTNDTPPLFGRVIDKPNYPNIAANVESTGFFPRPYLLPPTFTMNIGGIDVGFIGITSDMVPRMFSGLAQGMIFLQGEANYQARINTLANDLRTAATPAQIVVVMSELGIHKDKQLADIINPGAVDVFFSAHTHELTTTPLTSTSGALVVEAGNDTYLGRMDIVLDQTNVIQARNWTVVPIETTITGDATTQTAVDNVRAKYLVPNPGLTTPAPNSSQTLTQSITTVLATTNRPITRDTSLENSFNNLLTDLERQASNSQIAISRGFRFGVHLPGTAMSAANITIEDVYRFIPVPYTLSTGQVSGLRMKAIIEQNATEVYSANRFLHSGGWFDGYSGLSINLNLAQPDGQRLTSLDVFDAANNAFVPVLDTDIMSIIGCTRPLEAADTLCAYPGFVTGSVTPFLANNGTTYTAIDFLIDALQDPTLYDPAASPAARTNIIDSSNTPMWPAAEFIQPINGVP